MTKPTPLSQVVADDLLIDSVASRQPAGDDPIAGLLAALAEHADRPLGLAPSRRRFRRHRVLSTLAALTIGVSGAGVAAAATVPDAPPSAAPVRLAPAPDRPGSAPGAELVRDATGRVTVIGADGTQVESAWLPGDMSPVVLTPATDLGRASGAEASRNRWSAVGGATALVLAGLEPGLDGPAAHGVDSTGSDEPEQGAVAGAADDAAPPVDATATPDDGSAAEPTDGTTPGETPSQDTTDPSADQGESDESGTTPADAGTSTPTSTPIPTDPLADDLGSDPENPAAGLGLPPLPTDPLPPQASVPPWLPATGTQDPAPPQVSAPVGDGGVVATPTTPVMVPLPTVPVAVLPGLS